MLDELVSVIDTLKSRINEHRSILQGSEAQTRLSLIDPLLRALGWDTADPALVRPEYNLSGGRADYALLDPDRKPVAIIEAKKLNEQLGTMDHRMQMLTYANFSNVPYAGLTDGNQWVFYKVFDQKPLEERLVLNVSIADSQAYQCALQLLLLWRPNIASRQPIEASEPILGTEPPAPANSVPIQNPVQNVPVPSDASWVSLKDFVATPGTTPPKLRFPGGDELQPSKWRGLLIEVAEWLIRDGVLSQDRCPVTVGKNDAYSMVSLEPRHPNGKAFYASHSLSNGLFLAPHANANDIVHKCRAIMEHLGKDPASVHVQVG